MDDIIVLLPDTLMTVQKLTEDELGESPSSFVSDYLAVDRDHLVVDRDPVHTLPRVLTLWPYSKLPNVTCPSSFDSSTASTRPNGYQDENNKGSVSNLTSSPFSASGINGCQSASRQWSRAGGSGDGGDGGDDGEKPSDYSKSSLGCDLHPVKPKKKKERERKREEDSFEPLKQFLRQDVNQSGFTLDDRDSGRSEDYDDDNIREQIKSVVSSQDAASYPDRGNIVIYSPPCASILISCIYQIIQLLVLQGGRIPTGESRGVVFSEDLALSHRQYRRGNEYNAVRVLGRGDFGKVFHCKDSLYGTEFACKQIPICKFFPFEAFLHHGATSPHVVHFLGVVAEGSHINILMAVVPGGVQLESMIQNRGLPLNKVVDILMQILRALKHLHGRRIIHRDLNPRNILISKNGEVKVIDFTLATIEGFRPYHPNPCQGDIYYVAPEIAEFESELQGVFDIWSLACIVLALLRGHPNSDECERNASRGYHPLDCIHLRHIPDWLRDLLKLALAPDPAERITAAELLEKLEPHYSGSELVEERQTNCNVAEPRCLEDEVNKMNFAGSVTTEDISNEHSQLVAGPEIRDAPRACGDPPRREAECSKRSHRRRRRPSFPIAASLGNSNENQSSVKARGKSSSRFAIKEGSMPFPCAKGTSKDYAEDNLDCMDTGPRESLDYNALSLHTVRNREAEEEMKMGRMPLLVSEALPSSSPLQETGTHHTGKEEQTYPSSSFQFELVAQSGPENDNGRMQEKKNDV